MTADEMDELMQGELIALKAKLPANAAIVVIVARQQDGGVSFAGYSNVDARAARKACTYAPALFSDATTRRFDQ